MNNKSPEPLSKELKIYYIFSLIVVGISLISIFIYPIFIGVSISNSSKSWSEFGQYAGGVMGPLFGLLAFIGVLISIANQKIQNQKLDIENKKQAIESRILKQIEFHHKICNNVKIPYDLKRTKYKQGSLAFEFLFEKHLKTHYNEVQNQSPHLDEEQIIDVAFSKLYNKEGQQFGFYFRNLYYLIKYIDESQHIDREHFVRLIRAQLSTSELQMLMYNCLFKKGKGFKDLVIKYDLLNGVDNSELIKKEHHILIA